jgi:hypothetical protein
MHRASRLRIPGVHQHVESGCVPVFETERLYSFGNPGKIAPIYRHVDVARQPGSHGIALRDVEKNCQPANQAVLDARFAQGARYARQYVEELVHVFIVSRF